MSKHKKKKNIIVSESSSQENKSIKPKKRAKFIQKMISSIYGVMFKPIFGFVRKQIADLLDDINESIIQKITAVMFLLFAGFMFFAVFIGLGLLGSAALVDFAHWSWIKALVVVVLPFNILIMLITLIVGNIILHKPIIKIDTDKKEDD